MVNLPEDIDSNIIERIVNALDDDFHCKSPDFKLTAEFKVLVAHYIDIAYGIAATNIVDQMLEFIRVAKQIDPDVSIEMIEAYLKTTNFKSKPIKHKSYVRKEAGPIK